MTYVSQPDRIDSHCRKRVNMGNLEIEDRLTKIRGKIADAALNVGRNPNEIGLLAASKQQTKTLIENAISAGVTQIGENQVQEAESKFGGNNIDTTSIELHLIGSLQSNKVRRAVMLFKVIQSVDSLELAKRIELIANELDKQIHIYLEINLASESSKSGMDPERLTDVTRYISECKNLTLDGLMAIPPYREDPSEVRPFFRNLRNLRDDLLRDGPYKGGALGLSMGMSHDYLVAVEEGATLVRVGRAIWQGD